MTKDSPTRKEKQIGNKRNLNTRPLLILYDKTFQTLNPTCSD